MQLDAEQSARLVSSIELIAASLAALAGGAHQVAAPAPAADRVGAGVSPAPAAAPQEPEAAPADPEPSADVEDLKRQAIVVCTELARLGLNPSTSIQHHAGVAGISKVPEDQLEGLVAFLESELAKARS